MTSPPRSPPHHHNLWSQYLATTHTKITELLEVNPTIWLARQCEKTSHKEDSQRLKEEWQISDESFITIEVRQSKLKWIEMRQSEPTSLTPVPVLLSSISWLYKKKKTKKDMYELELIQTNTNTTLRIVQARVLSCGGASVVDWLWSKFDFTSISLRDSELSQPLTLGPTPTKKWPIARRLLASGH